MAIGIKKRIYPFHKHTLYYFRNWGGQLRTYEREAGRVGEG